MQGKFFALIIVVLFIATVFNSSIIAETDISRITMTKELIQARDKFDKLNDSVIRNCTETEDYSELLKFMGNNSEIKYDVHINSSGKGLFLAKRIRYIRLVHPLPRLTRLGFLPPAVLMHWIFYIDYFKDENATTEITPESGEPFSIKGNHSILALIWLIPPINKIFGLRNRLRKWTNGTINISLPWSLEKWRFEHFFPWTVYWLGIIPIGWLEGFIMLTSWPFNVITSFLGFRNTLKIKGMASFIIYTNSTATP